MKAKGLVVKDFPEHWTKWQNPDKPNDKFTKEEIEFNNKLLIEKRPYFMKYLYPKYKVEYNEHRKRYDYLCYRLYGIHIDELLNLENKTEEQTELAEKYNRFNPFLETDCPMNNICRYMEKEVSEIKINAKKKSPEITEDQIKEMEKVYKRYKKRNSQNKNMKNTLKAEGENLQVREELFDLNFDYISDDIQRLANLAVYVNYYLYPSSSKNFCWDLFGDGIVLNIYDNSNHNFKLPILDENGSIEYMGKKYENKGVDIECL